MELIADILMAAGAIAAGFYCFILGRRLNRFNDLEKGVGGAVAVLSAQVDDLTKTLAAAQTTAAKSADALTKLSARAEETSRKLELQMAALRDLEADQPETQQNSPAAEPLAAKPKPAPTNTPRTPSEPMFVRHRVSGDAA